MKVVKTLMMILMIELSPHTVAHSATVSYQTIGSLSAATDSVAYARVDTLIVIVKPQEVSWEAVDSSLATSEHLATAVVSTEWKSRFRLYQVHALGSFDSLLAEFAANELLLLANRVLEWRSGDVLLFEDQISVHALVASSDPVLDTAYAACGVEVQSYDSVDNRYALLRKASSDGRDLVGTAEQLLLTGLFEYCQPKFI